MSYIWVLLCVTGMVLLSGGHIGAQPPRLLSREALAQRLRHQEELFRTAEASFEVVRTPTRPEMIPLIKDVCRLRGEPKEADNYIVDEEYAKRNSYKARWWRKGEKERIEYYRLDEVETSTPLRVKAFDGQFVRSVQQGSDQIVGAVDTTNGANWTNTNRTHPLSLIHLYCDMPYSDIIERGTGYSATQVDVKGKPGVRIFVHYPKADYTRFSLLFDSSDQLVERRIISKIGRDKDYRVYSIHRFDEYRLIENPTGDSVRMPMVVTQQHVCGEHSPEVFAEYWVDTVRINRLVLNIDIPDSKFDLRIPNNAAIWDGVGGRGWLRPGDQPDYLFPKAAERRKQWWTWGIAAFSVIAIVGGILYARRRARRAGDATPTGS